MSLASKIFANGIIVGGFFVVGCNEIFKANAYTRLLHTGIYTDKYKNATSYILAYNYSPELIESLDSEQKSIVRKILDDTPSLPFTILRRNRDFLRESMKSIPAEMENWIC